MGEELRDRVRERYAGVARSVSEGEGSGGRALDSEAPEVDWTGGSYSEGEKRELPWAAVEASLGCGNPVALATLSPGEVVLDLGSGGGIDVLLSARRVAPGGRAFGLDMTDEMLELARENRRKAGVENAEFLKGEIEDIPLPDDHVDVVISNCVINLSTAARAIGEAFRVLEGLLAGRDDGRAESEDPAEGAVSVHPQLGPLSEGRGAPAVPRRGPLRGLQRREGGHLRPAGGRDGDG